VDIVDVTAIITVEDIVIEELTHAIGGIIDGVIIIMVFHTLHLISLHGFHIDVVRDVLS
jgi:hypothetical protein